MRWPLLASLWAVLFAAAHLAWAGGWYVGLESEEAAAAFARPWFLAYDIVVALGCFVAAGAFGGLAANYDGRFRSAARVVSVAAAAVVVLRAVTGLGAIAWRGWGSVVSVSGWDLWFVAGAVLFTGALRTRPQSSRTAREVR